MSCLLLDGWGHAGCHKNTRHVLKAVTKQHLCAETSEESLDSRRRIIECFYCSMMI